MALHDDADMAAQLDRTLIGTYVGACDLGEAIATAQRVSAGNYDQWHDEWLNSAQVAQDAALRAEARGLPALAARAFLRAAEYQRQSYFFLRHDVADARVRSAYRNHRDLFRRATRHLPYVIEPISIPFDPVPLKGYVFRPSDDERPRPTVLFPGGFDGTSEEMYKYGARGALNLGWNAVTWDGPGQGGMLVEHGVPMRPNFEAVLTPVVDWALGQRFVAPDALAVVGRSLGGYLAPRGVSHDDRVRALVCDPGQVDFTSRFVAMFSPEDWQRVCDAEPEMEAQLEGFLDGERNREFYGSRMATMGAATFGAWLRVLGTYSLEGMVQHIACPTLVTEGEGDFASQSERLFDALTCEKQFRRFSQAEGGGGHCEGMAQTLWEETAFGFLSEILGARVN